ncbi:hypothetical protein OAT11_05170 [Nitrospinaceae bacterium]|nr:hypothetical protein [Nitrospinaceae bacterium]
MWVVICVIKGGEININIKTKKAIPGTISLAIRYRVHKYKEKNKVAGKLKAIVLNPKIHMNGTARIPPVRPKYRA